MIYSTSPVARFIKPKAVANVKHIINVKFNKRSNQKEDYDLVIGAKTKQYLQDNIVDKTSFYESVRKFYDKACDYIINNFPMEDRLLKHAHVADISKQFSASFESIEYFHDKFPFLNNIDLDILQEQFNMYQIERLPIEIKKSQENLQLKLQKLPYDEKCVLSMDQQWSVMEKIVDATTGLKKYNDLCVVMFSILTIPHANPEPDQI